MIKFTNMQLKGSAKHKTKVGFIITKGVWGGAQKYVYNLATSLPQNKYDVFVITGPGGILKRKLEEAPFRLAKIRVYEIDSLERDISIFKELTSFIQIFKIVLKESPHVLHLNSPKASGIGSVVGRFLLVPNIVQTIHGWSFNEKQRNIFSRFVIYLFSWVTTLLCTKTIVIAREEKRQALNMPFVRESKISLIKNGIEDIKFIDKKIVRKALLDRLGKKEYEVNENTLWLGTISELHKNKGLKYIIEALALFDKNFVFFVIGEGEEREYLERLIVEKGLQKKVFLIGFIDIANLYLKAFDVFTLTSIKEGLPYTLLEAGKASVCVLASNTGGIPDIIDDGKNGVLCKKKDVKEIVKDLEFLYSNPEKRKEYAEKLKDKIDKNFTTDEMIKKTILLYK